MGPYDRITVYYTVYTVNTKWNCRVFFSHRMCVRAFCKHSTDVVASDKRYFTINKKKPQAKAPIYRTVSIAHAQNNNINVLNQVVLQRVCNFIGNVTQIHFCFEFTILYCTVHATQYIKMFKWIFMWYADLTRLFPLRVHIVRINGCAKRCVRTIFKTEINKR